MYAQSHFKCQLDSTNTTPSVMLTTHFISSLACGSVVYLYPFIAWFSYLSRRPLQMLFSISFRYVFFFFS